MAESKRNTTKRSTKTSTRNTSKTTRAKSTGTRAKTSARKSSSSAAQQGFDLEPIGLILLVIGLILTVLLLPLSNSSQIALSLRFALYNAIGIGMYILPWPLIVVGAMFMSRQNPPSWPRLTLSYFVLGFGLWTFLAFAVSPKSILVGNWGMVFRQSIMSFVGPLAFLLSALIVSIAADFMKDFPPTHYARTFFGWMAFHTRRLFNGFLERRRRLKEWANFQADIALVQNDLKDIDKDLVALGKIHQSKEEQASLERWRGGVTDLRDSLGVAGLEDEDDKRLLEEARDMVSSWQDATQALSEESAEMLLETVRKEEISDFESAVPGIWTWLEQPFPTDPIIEEDTSRTKTLSDSISKITGTKMPTLTDIPGANLLTGSEATANAKSSTTVLEAKRQSMRSRLEQLEKRYEKLLAKRDEAASQLNSVTPKTLVKAYEGHTARITELESLAEAFEHLRVEAHQLEPWYTFAEQSVDVARQFPEAEPIQNFYNTFSKDFNNNDNKALAYENLETWHNKLIALEAQLRQVDENDIRSHHAPLEPRPDYSDGIESNAEQAGHAGFHYGNGVNPRPIASEQILISDIRNSNQDPAWKNALKEKTIHDFSEDTELGDLPRNYTEATLGSGPANDDASFSLSTAQQAEPAYQQAQNDGDYDQDFTPEKRNYMSPSLQGGLSASTLNVKSNQAADDATHTSGQFQERAEQQAQQRNLQHQQMQQRGPAPRNGPNNNAGRAAQAPLMPQRPKAFRPDVALEIPKLDLLEAGPTNSASSATRDRKIIVSRSKIIDRTIESFRLKGEVQVDSSLRGPTVTRFEVRPGEGEKISRYANLSDDIALALGVAKVRIEAPIQGKKDIIGLEVPNEHRDMVRFREVLESQDFKNKRRKKGELPIIVGKTIEGNFQVLDLAKMPHLLIAGSTGSGKSVAVNTLISSLLYQYLPTELRFLMIDPKMVELTPYDGIPHLLRDVVTNPNDAAAVLLGAVGHMERRYKMMSKIGAKSLMQYNQKAKELDMPEMPYIVIIIDELADLMITSPKEVESAIMRLAQMARATDMHLVLATQRPSVDIITSLIKVNVPARMAFAVASSHDSRTILDATGAERLTGKGDMLYYQPGQVKPERLQGPFVDEDEIVAISNFLKQQTAFFEDEFVEAYGGDFDPMPDANAASNSLVDWNDDKLREAANMVVNEGQASVSRLQRRLSVGHARAGKLMDSLEALAIVGPYQGSKPRDVLVDPEELFHILGSH